jgi:hypothetical protein
VILAGKIAVGERLARAGRYEKRSPAALRATDGYRTAPRRPKERQSSGGSRSSLPCGLPCWVWGATGDGAVTPIRF